MTPTSPTLRVLLVLSLSGVSGAFSASPVHAQIRASELAAVSQTVDGTTLKVTYSRPRMRGRWPIFGTRAVQWGEVWTPGANYATLLETDRDMLMENIQVPKGKYSVWMVVRKDSAWTMLLDPKWRQFHMDHPVPNATQIHIPLRIDSAEVEDILSWSFPRVQVSGGTLAMHWARTRASVDFSVTPTLSDLLPELEARAYVGRYALRDRRTQKDSGVMVVTYEQGKLRGDFEPADDYLKRFVLMRVASDVFTVGLYDGSGALYEVLRPDMMLTFTRALDGGVSFEARGGYDVLFFTGRRQTP